MSDQPKRLATKSQNSERLDELLHQLSVPQLRYSIARLETKTDKEAAEMIGLTAGSVKSWDNKADVDEVVQLMAFDQVRTALEIRRRVVGKAMAIKAAGLDSDNERVRQATATEIIEWELGKANLPVDMNVRGMVEIYIPDNGRALIESEDEHE